MNRPAMTMVGFGALLVVSVAAAAPPRSHPVVSYRQGRLTIHAQATPAKELFTAIAEKTGVRFVVDSEIHPTPITIDIDDMELERGIRNVVGQVREAAGQSMSYGPDVNGEPRLRQVALFAAGKAAVGADAAVYGAEATPIPPSSAPAPDPMESMSEAGVPRETAQKLADLNGDMQKLDAAPAPGSYRLEDLPPESREYVQPLIDRGMSMERAVQILLVQRHYQETMKEMWQAGGGRSGKFDHMSEIDETSGDDYP